MKLEEAAAILGVHPDTPIETLKQTYRRLALAWHPEKVGVTFLIFELVAALLLLSPNKTVLSCTNLRRSARAQMRRKSFNRYQ
jgi:curved DNA-binding protein CbpA